MFVVIRFVVVVMGVVIFVVVMVAVVVTVVVIVRFASSYESLSLKFSARIVYTLFFISFSLFQAAILHQVVLFLLLQHNSWNFFWFYANSKGHDFRSAFHLTCRSNITDVGFPGLGQRYVARTQYK